MMKIFNFYNITKICLLDGHVFIMWKKELILTHLSLASLLWDIGKQNSPRWDAAERGVPSGAILFAYRNFIEKLNKIKRSLLTPLKMKVDSP